MSLSVLFSLIKWEKYDVMYFHATFKSDQTHTADFFEYLRPQRWQITNCSHWVAFERHWWTTCFLILRNCLAEPHADNATLTKSNSNKLFTMIYQLCQATLKFFKFIIQLKWNHWKIQTGENGLVMVYVMVWNIYCIYAKYMYKSHHYSLQAFKVGYVYEVLL